MRKKKKLKPRRRINWKQKYDELEREHAILIGKKRIAGDYLDAFERYSQLYLQLDKEIRLKLDMILLLMPDHLTNFEREATKNKEMQ